MILLLGMLLILTSCAPKTKDDDNNEDKVLQKESESTKDDTSLVPSQRLSKKNYQIPIPYRTSAASGVFYKQLWYRIDYYEMEEGFSMNVKTVFETEVYTIEEGQSLETAN